MPLSYRIQKYRDEEGEYSEYYQDSEEGIQSLIETNWKSDDSPNQFKTISIANKSNQHLIIDHFNKHVFDIYFLPANAKFHYHKKSVLDDGIQALTLFASNQISEIEQFLNKRTKENKYIRGDFFYKDHNYRITKKRNVKELIWLFVYGLPLGLMFSFLGVVLFGIPIEFIFFPIFILTTGTYMWLPGILLHIQYFRDGDGLEVYVTQGNKVIFIKDQTQQIEIGKAEINQVIKFENPAYKNPWSDYGYTEIKFNDGRLLNLTNLQVDQLFILEKFKYDNVETKTIKKMIPKLRNKTTATTEANRHYHP